MDFLKSWVSSICVTILFMTAIELIMPENSMKNYSKFVLGLIFIVVVINPIIGLVNNEEDLYKSIIVNEDYIDKIDKYIESDMKEYNDSLKNLTIQNFKDNLERNCVQILRNKFKNNNFIVDVALSYESQEYIIEELKVKVENLGVKEVETIEKVIIGKSDVFKNENKLDSKSKEIKKILSGELNISENIIKVYS